MRILEQGHIYFLFRPRVEMDRPERLEDIQKLYMVLHPRGQRRYRFILIGRKKLPDPSMPGREKYWGFVEHVVSTPREFPREELAERYYQTSTRGLRWQPGARAAGEGVYALVDHDTHAHLAYVLDPATIEGRVHEAMNIRPEASYVISVKNPDSPIAADPTRFAAPHPELLNDEGAEIILISASDDVKAELGIDLNAAQESETSLDIFKELQLERSSHRRMPLFERDVA
jgi:hypothetical protein